VIRPVDADTCTAFKHSLDARDRAEMSCGKHGACLKSVKPINNKVAAPLYREATAREDVPGAGQQMSEAHSGDKVKHGFYLATIAHCMECHTPETGGRHDFSLLGKGGREFKARGAFRSRGT
jgi:hypothetical protein